jgi:hypothetical protein
LSKNKEAMLALPSKNCLLALAVTSFSFLKDIIMDSYNEIYLRRKNKVAISKQGKVVLSSADKLLTLNRNLQSLGYILSLDVLDVLTTYNDEELTVFTKNLVKVLKEFRGVRKYEPMYPNFPQQVIDASYMELYCNAMMHYLGFWLSDLTGNRSYEWLPRYEKLERPPLDEEVNLTVITLGTMDDFISLFNNLVRSNTSLSPTDKADLEYVAKRFKLDLSNVPHKENLATLGKIFFETTQFEDLSVNFKVSTDVLRLAVALSDGDTSLAQPCKFRNFKREERRQLLRLLEVVFITNKITLEDMLLWEGRWLRLGEKLHPGEYSARYPKTFEAFNALRNNEKIETFNSKVEKAIKQKNNVLAVETLTARPGMLARRLDQLLRNGSSTAIIEFAGVSLQVSTPVLLQVLTHFRYRNTYEKRVIMPKGQAAKMKVLDNNLGKLSTNKCKAIVNICQRTLLDRFSELPELGNVYIDEKLENYFVPFSQRSASKALRTLVRGSKIDLPEGGNTLRFFIWWNENANGLTTGRTDLDLSAIFLKSDWSVNGNVAYWQLRDGDMGWHSGDITSAPNGACEFIDINMEKALAKETRYVLMNVNSYTRQAYKDIPECFAGWMLRSKPNSGEIFDARTVQDKVDLTAESRVAVPVIFDLVERKAIWADLSAKAFSMYNNNTYNNRATLQSLAQGIATMRKPDLRLLLTLHATARGKLVNDPNEADIVFDSKITPFETEKIMGEYLR